MLSQYLHKCCITQEIINTTLVLLHILLLLLQAKSPSAGQFTALGIYLLACLIFVVGAMIEYAILLHMRRMYEHKWMYESVLSKASPTNLTADGKLNEPFAALEKPTEIDMLIDDQTKKENWIPGH